VSPLSAFIVLLVCHLIGTAIQQTFATAALVPILLHWIRF
jgi:hypothetical protein